MTLLQLSALNAISPVDGRYHKKTRALSLIFSEFGLIHHRLMVEIRWFQSLADNPKIPEVPKLDQATKKYLNQIIDAFDENEAKAVKSYEKRTNHDVKAVEYYLRDKFDALETLKPLKSFIHFACTSEDINNLAYALMIKNTLNNVVQPILAEIIGGITLLGKQHGHFPMLCRTHGQPATPSTLGKELINFAARLKRPMQQLAEVLISAKCNGAVGNFNAHVAAYPDVDWRNHSHKFITKLGLSPNAYTTQIEPHDGIAEVSHLMVRMNNILLDYTKDIWSYISLGYFKQKTIKDEVGSSTMPHKVNPIDFENAEGNLGLANTLFSYFANKLTQSRLQRDLSDSTVLRNLGVAFAYSLISYLSIAKGNGKLEVNPNALEQDLAVNWEVVTEAIQTVMRKHHQPNAYEALRDFSRGKTINQDMLQAFIHTLELPDDVKASLLNLTPTTYTGLAQTLVKAFL